MFTNPVMPTKVPDIQATSFFCCSGSALLFLLLKKSVWPSSIAPMQNGSQNIMPRYTSAIVVAVVSSPPAPVMMAAMAASTTPTPCGVGEMMTETAASANAATSTGTSV